MHSKPLPNMSYTGPNDHGSHIDTGIGGVRKINTTSSHISGTFSSIPIVDLTDATSPSLDARKKVARQIHEACVNVGFFYIKNHGVEEDVIEGVKHEARRFFHDLAEEDKMELDITKNTEFYGYAPIRANNTGAQTKKRTFPTRSESISI
jgi:isopenicillin N synthase-like dioxygenase